MINVNSILNKYYEEGSALLNLLTNHSEMVARKALECADRKKLILDRSFIYEAAMLHDIGIIRCNAPSIFCQGDEPYIRHGIIGADMLRMEGLPDHARVCERHTGSGLTAVEIAESDLPLPHCDFLPETLEEKLICYADKFFSKSGNPTEEKNIDRVMRSMEKFGPAPFARFKALHSLFS